MYPSSLEIYQDKFVIVIGTNDAVGHHTEIDIDQVLDNLIPVQYKWMNDTSSLAAWLIYMCVLVIVN